jgi:hypothetical protein
VVSIARKLASLLALTFVLSGCAVYKSSAPPTGASYRSPDSGRVLIRSGSLDLRARDLGAVQTSIEEIVLRVDGRIQDWSLTDGKWLSMSLRVPEPSLDKTMDEIATLGKVVGRSLRSRDVTEQLIDFETRLKNLRALRDRLRSYLDQATNLEEILAVERELARVQTEIESIEAKLKVLQDQIAMSELDVTVRKKKF